MFNYITSTTAEYNRVSKLEGNQKKNFEFPKLKTSKMFLRFTYLLMRETKLW